MSTPKYDPAFAKPVTPNHEGDCEFVRVTRLFEACKRPGCKVGRYSREWINGLKGAHQPEAKS